MRPRILLLGNTGQLGWELNRSLLTLGEITAMDFPEINMADPDDIVAAVQKAQPDLIINATAYTNVEKAESERDLAEAINGRGPGVLAEEARKLKAALIHYSTDYVFDGTKGEPYIEEDSPNPLSAYGETKLDGERAVQEVGGAYLIFRTSWVYSLRRPCFVANVLRWARNNEVLRVVDDQISAPTWSRTLAESTAQIIAQGKGMPIDFINHHRGLYHLTDGGYCSRYEWAKAVIKLDPHKEEQVVKKIMPANSSDFNTAAVRPTFSKLSCEKVSRVFNIKHAKWSHVIKIAFDKSNPEQKGV